MLGDAGFEDVRMVAIDDEWGALRFRRIKQFTRPAKNSVSKAGKQRATR